MSSTLRSVTLHETRGSTFLNHEKELALKALLDEGDFRPETDLPGPYDLNLSIQDGRLVFEMRAGDSTALPVLVLSVRPYTRLVRDYFMIIESYETLRRDGDTARLEAVDMGRRGLHDEGAKLLRERLLGKINLDHATARRVFTLICVLHSQNFPVF